MYLAFKSVTKVNVIHKDSLAAELCHQVALKWRQ